MARDADAVGRLVERLESEPGLRSEFRRDPVAVARRLGAPDLADELLATAGDPLQTLDRRESRSSLAGVVFAAAVEGMGLSELLPGDPSAATHGDPDPASAAGIDPTDGGSGGRASADALALLHD